jgi:hypothetical protein
MQLQAGENAVATEALSFPRILRIFAPHGAGKHRIFCPKRRDLQ